MAIDWLNENEKYAAFTLEVKLEDGAASARSGDVALIVGGQFPLDEHWRGWMGSVAVEHVEDANLFLVASMPSAAPGILDAESAVLKQRAYNTYVGLQLVSRFAPAHKPMLILGGLESGELTVRSLDEFDVPVPSIAVPYPEVTMDELHRAVAVGANLHAITTADIPGGYWRLFRTLRIYTESRTNRDLVERVHQFSRCIDGLILPAIGETKKQFKSKTELFIGPGHADLMGEIYDLRSADEHLNDNKYFEEFDREVRLGGVKKELVVEYIARTALARIIGTPALWPHFANHDALYAFWKLEPAARRAIWGEPIDLAVATADFEPHYINDAALGRK